MNKAFNAIPKKSASEPRLIDSLRIPIDEPIELAVCAVKRTGIRCKLVPSQEPITYRNVRSEVEGEIITVKPAKIWQFKNTVYMSGETIGYRLDVQALGLKPLDIEEEGVWDPDEEEDFLDENDPYEKYYLPIMAYGARKEYEMEQILPFHDPDDYDSDPIMLAIEAYEQEDYQTAYKIIEDVLVEDLRCIDAHAHLGNWEFNSYDTPHKRTEDRALRHYEAGLRIGELSFKQNFNDLLPWSHIDNRPYLRCMHGYGLCLWRGGKMEEAKKVFEKMLWLNPRDNQGARCLLADIDAGKDWYQCQASEGAL